MHEYAKELMTQLKCEIDKVKCADCVDAQTIDDLKDWSEIVKNIASFDKDYNIVKAMKEAESNDEIMEKVAEYTDVPPTKMYYNTRRYSDGRYAPSGAGHYVGRHGYESYMPEYERDIDMGNGRMYYYGDMRSPYDGRSTHSRKGYMETKQVHKGNTAEDKQAKMQELEKYSKDLTDDVMEMIADASPEEKTMLKAKITNLAQRI